MTKIKDEEVKIVNGGTDEVSGSAAVGGFCGSVTGDAVTTIENCFNVSNTTDVTGTSSAGGICGTASDNTTVINCYNTGKISL